MPLDMMVSPNHGFLKEKNILLDVIKTACNAGNWTIQHRTRFVYDLLCVVQHVEDWDNDTYQANFRYTLETIFGTWDKLINPTSQLLSSSYSFSFLKNCLMFQSLERLLQNKWKLPEIKLQHDESVILNRVYERLYSNLDITSEENDFEQRTHTDNDRIRVISKWKVQLTKYINTIDTDMNGAICQYLSYFQSHQKLFGDAWKAYQRSFHIWF
ncbi:hypothetical protein RFI_33747 [Reticulomyxa filosa]|uniref:Uncharacterized protein n=1 Tax=Reticulomyxa filosa TaxID=46433 RepID=X6LSC9_RETFI|nr:hypothetical protein RFI_33747 [Reticulomyxa filosa]|eukprot:ETO03655.1 hypothetical protein RFI_33747 [Reticulomyxa filosa]